MEELAWATRRLRRARRRRSARWRSSSRTSTGRSRRSSSSSSSLVQSIDDAPVLVLCAARPSLGDADPDWGTGPRATRIDLEPLDGEASRTMVESLLGGGTARGRGARPHRRRSRGQPALRGAAAPHARGRGHARAPRRHVARDRPARRPPRPADDPGPPRGAPRRAREPDERSVIEPASVVGYIFAEAAVSALAPPDVSPRVMTEIATLTQKHLVQSRRRRRRDAAPLPAHHDPRHRLRRDPQAGPRGSPRALRRLGRRGQPRPRRRVRGDPRLPPRAGVDVPLRARAARRSRPRDRRGRGAPPRVGRQARLCARRRPRRRDTSRPGGGTAPRRSPRSACSCFPITARRS